MPLPQYIDIYTRTPLSKVRCLFGPNAPVVTGGYGGWEVVDRPRRKGITRWGGIAPIVVELNLILDGYYNGQSKEGDCLALEKMARPIRSGDEPPIVKTDGRIPYRDKDWIITDLTWGAVIRSSSGDRMRAELNITLSEYVADDRVAFKKAAERSREKDSSERAAAARSRSSGKATARRTYSVREGETLQRVAANELGDYRLWATIADLNGIRDPNSLTVGQEIILP